MKYFIVGLSSIISVSVTPALQAQEKLRLLSIDAPPYIFQLSDGSLAGLFYDRIKCVLEKIEQPYSIEFQPWLRAQIEVRAGRASGFFPATRDDQRDAYATFSNSLIEVESDFYSLKTSTLDPQNPEFKEKAIISALWGSTQYRDLHNENYKVGPVAHSLESLFGLVERGRVDAILVPDFVAETILENKGTLKNYKKSFYSSHRSGVYITNAYLEQYPTFLTRFNEKIAECIPKKMLDE
jgi:polar amino acid transport system substrate-binding protein